MSYNQYKYEEMSNMVLKPGRRPREEILDAPSSLSGRISVKEMGSRVERVKPTSENDQERPSKNPSTTKSDGYAPEVSTEVSYYPTTAENGHIFELLMTLVNTILPDSSHEVILSAADAVLDICKQQDVNNKQKQSEIEALLETKLDSNAFDEILKLCNRITDYDAREENEETEENLDGVPIVFDEEDEEDENPQDSEEEDDKIVGPSIEPNDQDSSLVGSNDITVKTETTQSASESNIIPLHEIDQYYLQRRLASIYGDENASETQTMAEKMNKLLQNADLLTRDLENELMEILDYDHFDLVTFCLENRWRLVYKMKLLDGVEETKVYDEMRSLNLHGLVDEFQGVRQSSKRRLSDLETSVKKQKKISTKRQPREVDLSALAFDQGSHMISTNRVKLPPGSYQQKKKLYDIISIPAPTPAEDNDPLISISELPSWAQEVFPSSETTNLNRIQSKIYPSAFKTDENLLLCAPTGAGKTNVAMLTILRTLEHYRKEDGRFDLGEFKIVYVAPLKALVQEQKREFERRLTPTFGITVNELTGDSSLSAQQISETQIIVTTPEKWDVITRKGSEVPHVSLTRLVIIDEIHLLHDDRGPVLESIIARTQRQMESSGEPIRLVGLSATLPNYKDVAKFLRVDFEKGLFYFDATYRPCPLEQHFIGIKEKKAIKKVQAMNEACYDKMIESLESKHQIIIFVHSRKDTYKTAVWLRDKLVENEKLNLVQTTAGSKEILRQEAEAVRNQNLAEVIGGGFGMHHAGLNRDERSLVEDLFAQGHIRVLVSTATLAWGVNLPAHTVVIKGTETYSPELGSWVQLSPQDILQMLGRAGRPRYDKSGEGVIITSLDDIQYYLAILNQQLPIESQMMLKLVDIINAEVVLGSVTTRQQVVEWLSYTYLYIRMLRAPALYRVGADYADDKLLSDKREDLSHSALQILHRHKMVQYDMESGAIKLTELGKIASHFYIGYETISAYNNNLKSWLTIVDVFRIFCMSGEFRLIPIRQEEKLEVTKLAQKCPIPIKEAATEPIAKVNVLLQTYISRLSLDGFALVADMVYITQSAGRLFRALHEIALKKKWSAIARTTLDVCKMVERRMWLVNSPLRQFGELASPQIIRAAEGSHLPWNSYFNLEASELAEAIAFKGNSQKVHQLLQQFPRNKMDYLLQPITSKMIRVQFEIVPNFNWNVNLHGNLQRFLLLIEDCDGETILFSDNFTVYRRNAQKPHIIEAAVPFMDPEQPQYFALVISESWINCETRIPLMLNNIQVPKKGSSFTELLDLHSVETSELKNEAFSKCFDFRYFNRFQSQAFNALYWTSHNVLVGMSKNNGKTVCAELAVLAHWRAGGGRIVYLNPNLEKLKRVGKSWSKRFHGLTDPPKEINCLSGDPTVDLALLSSSHLVLATPDQWDRISRRWKQRRAIQSVDLYVADDVHLIGNGEGGVQYENVLARTRFISTQVEHNIRIVALSMSLANGRDFGEWLGCSKQNIFNFHSGQRFRKIEEIRIQAKASNTNISLLSSSVHSQLTKGNGTSLVFTSNRKDCLVAAVEYMNKIVSDEINLLKVESDDMIPYFKKVSDKMLVKLLERGIGIYHDDMVPLDKLIVERMFESDYLKVLFATKSTAKYSPSASNILVMGTQEYDGREHGYVDYTLVDMMEMVGCCSDNGKVLIMTTPAKLEYYNYFLNEALPVESHVGSSLHDVLLHEISSRSLRAKQECIDWLTFTYFYRRIQLNPSFYDVKDTSHLGISEYLSELIENTLNDLAQAQMIELEDEDEEEEEEVISPLNGAMIAAYHNVSYLTMKEFSRLDNKARMRGILEVITSASEFESLPIREDEEVVLSRIYHKVPIKTNSVDYDSPYFKAFVLLQAHFSRFSLPADLALDQKIVLQKVLDVLHACVDHLSSEGYLNALQAMDMSQMIVQGLWSNDNVLKQVPGFTDEIIARCTAKNVEMVFDIMALEDDERDEILQLEGPALNKVAEFVNSYPNIDVSYELDLSQPVRADEPAQIKVLISRDEDVDDLLVVSERYPWPKNEGWWIVLGDSASKQLYAIKRATVSKQDQSFDLEFTVPNAGAHNLTLWCMCDSYLDADKEVEVNVTVQ